MNKTSDYIRRDKAINTIAGITTTMSVCLNLDECHGMKKMQQQAVMGIANMPPEDVQPVTFCKDCRWLADIKDVDTGEMYHTCGVLGFDVPDGFACNQGKRKGADND